MQPVYATRLVIWPDKNHPVESLHSSVVSVCYKWLHVVATKFNTLLPEDWLADVQIENEQENTLFSIDHLIVNGEQAWRAVAVHPYLSPDTDLRMRIEIQARYDDGEEIVTLRLLLGTTRDRIRPLAVHLKRPRLITDLLDEFAPNVSSGNMGATRYATYLNEDEVMKLCHTILQSDRLAPVVVISRDEHDDLICGRKTITKMAQEIAGLGRVYVLPSFASAYKLSDGVTKDLSCFNGAVRIYWPDFSTNDSPYSHNLWLASRLVDPKEHLAHRLPGIIFNLVSAASGIGIGSDNRSWNIYRLAQDAKTQAIIERRDELARQEIAASEDDYYEAVGQLETLRKQKADNDETFASLVQENEDMRRSLKNKIYTLEAENTNLKFDISNRTITDDREYFGDIIRASSLSTLYDAVNFMASICSKDYLIFLPEAFESARRASYRGKVSSIVSLMVSLRYVAMGFHEETITDLRQAFIDAEEPDFTPTISLTAKQQYARDYKRRYQSNGATKEIMLEPHIRFGGGNKHSSVSIYWYIDTESRVFVVGHVGEHLGNKQDT